MLSLHRTQMAVRERRSWWVAALARVAELGDLAAEGGELSREQVFELAGYATRAPLVAFPLPFASAIAACAGFRELVRGFATAADPQVKAALGGAAAAAARCAQALLDLDHQQTAAVQRRRYGED